MFTGIIERAAFIQSIRQDESNMHISIASDIASELSIDQSVAHNGICLTVVDIIGNSYTVTAIKETISQTTIKYWKAGDTINLERSMRLGERLDGHLVQGHVDQVAQCMDIQDELGSKVYCFRHEPKFYKTVSKGSITVDGVSLTVVSAKQQEFTVAIIPYTLEYTTFKFLKPGSFVNLEFDIIGKYVQRLLKK